MSPETPWQPDWKAIDGNRFQDLCLDLLSREGYELQDQGIGPDGGVDAILVQAVNLPDDTAKQIRWAAQFKFKLNPDATVKPHELGNVENILGRFQAEGFFLITNGRVTNKALCELRGSLLNKYPSYYVSVWTRRHLESRLSVRREVAHRYFVLPDAVARPTATFEVTIDITFEEFSDLQRRLLRHALASFLEVPVTAVTIRKVSAGSTKVLIEVPEESAQRLRDALANNDFSLDTFGFKTAILSVTEVVSALSLIRAKPARVPESSKLDRRGQRIKGEEPVQVARDFALDRENRFRDLYQRYYRSVVAYIVRLGIPLGDARELAQEVFLRVYRSMGKYQGEAEWTFVQTIARNVAFNEIRRHTTTKRSGSTVPRKESWIARTSESPEAEFAERDEAVRRSKWLHEAIAELPEGLRTSLLLWLSGHTYREIQVIMHLSLDGVKSRLYEARSLLRARLAKEEREPPE